MKRLLFLVIILIATLMFAACGGGSEEVPEEREGLMVLSVSGMTCPRCEAVIQREIERFDGVINVDANNRNNTVAVEYELGADLDELRRDIIRAITLEGFVVSQ